MCFNVRKRGREHIAKKDIVCYKILKNNHQSFFRYYIYSKGILCEKVGLVIDGYNQINYGYHSYRSFLIVWWKKVFMYTYGDIKKFIIPKGSRYYKNNTQFVSNQIMMV